MGSGDRQTDKTQTGRHCSRATPDAKQAQEGLTVVITGTEGGQAGGRPGRPWVRGAAVRGLSSAPPLSLISEEEQGALSRSCHHQLPGPLRLPGGPHGGLCPLSAAQVRRPWHCPLPSPLGL